MDLLNRRRQAQCPGWTFEKYRALFFRALISVFVPVSYVVVLVLRVFLFVIVFVAESGALEHAVLCSFGRSLKGHPIVPRLHVRHTA